MSKSREDVLISRAVLRIISEYELSEDQDFDRELERLRNLRVISIRLITLIVVFCDSPFRHMYQDLLRLLK